ncbi:hypothetical protein [Nannocystis pusilla]|uniref:hypothetical protein n=1 Tax=Nannocystis pusilla TaxID=889268 RepID=UPI003B8203A5
MLLGGDAGFLLERRLASRLDHLSLGSYLEYYHYLSYDLGGSAELLECIERVTTHETYLFREQFQLDAFQREILPVLLGRRGPGRRWCGARGARQAKRRTRSRRCWPRTPARGRG